MTAPRLFSILRRKPGLIDLITPIRPASELVEQYRLKADVANNPGGLFATTVMTVPRTGKVDPAVAGPQHVIQPGENVRMIFKPSNFSLSDTDAFWIKLVYIDGASAEMVTPAPGAATLVLPPFTGPLQSGFTASAPTGTGIADALQLDLPRAMENVRILNLDGANPLYVAFDPGGPEMLIPFGKELTGFFGLVSTMFVRSTGGAVQFTTSFTFANPR
jgi:hypothetical protein